MLGEMRAREPGKPWTTPRHTQQPKLYRECAFIVVWTICTIVTGEMSTGILREPQMDTDGRE